MLSTKKEPSSDALRSGLLAKLEASGVIDNLKASVHARHISALSKKRRSARMIIHIHAENHMILKQVLDFRQGL